VLYLDGNISSSLRADIAVDQVYGVQGLLEIKSNLVGDDQLAADLALALGQDPRTRDLPIGVYPKLGVVRLSGAVHNGSRKRLRKRLPANLRACAQSSMTCLSIPEPICCTSCLRQRAARHKIRFPVSTSGIRSKLWKRQSKKKLLKRS